MFPALRLYLLQKSLTRTGAEDGDTRPCRTFGLSLLVAKCNKTANSLQPHDMPDIPATVTDPVTYSISVGDNLNPNECVFGINNTTQ